MDEFDGTIYRDITNASDALNLARFHSVEDGIGHDAAAAVRDIDAVMKALYAAREKLVHEVVRAR